MVEILLLLFTIGAACKAANIKEDVPKTTKGPSSETTDLESYPIIVSSYLPEFRPSIWAQSRTLKFSTSGYDPVRHVSWTSGETWTIQELSPEIRKE